MTPLQEFFLSRQPSLEGDVYFNFPLSQCTYYRIGGPAEVLFSPKGEQDLFLIAECLKRHQTDAVILGAGSNVLVSDRGISGLVVRTNQLNKVINVIERTESFSVTLGSGVSISQLVREGSAKGWAGVEALVGIPGLVGGMIAMNAGTHLGEVKEFVSSLKLFNLETGKFWEFNVNRMDLTEYFSYRTAKFLAPSHLIYEVHLEFPKSDPALVSEKVQQVYFRRKQTQPVNYPSCGSVFKNPPDYPKKSWQIIDELGLRGYRIGNAQISEKHPNFIINLGNAKASDVYQLIHLVKARAAEKGIYLNEEVKILGFFDNLSL